MKPTNKRQLAIRRRIVAKPYYQQRKLPLTITKSNELVRAQLQVENNGLANKIFYLLIRAMDIDLFPRISVNAKELGVGTGGSQYRAIDVATDVLLNAKVKTVFKDSEHNLGFRKSNIFTDCDYEKGIITAKLNIGMKPHLLELKKRFTVLNYFELMDLPSFYSQRIYEILKSWEKPEGFVELKLDPFYDMISFPKEMRGDFSFVRRKALEKAEKDINARTDLKFKWEPIKEGKKVIGLRFIIGESSPVLQKKWQAKKEEKARREAWEKSARRKPHLNAAIACRQEKGIKPGGICSVMKLRTKKCQLCRQAASVQPAEGRLF